jgi:hypothetical protein
MRRVLFMAVLLLPPLGVQATQIYRYVDDEGNVVFSGQPPAGRAAERVMLPPVNAVGGAPGASRSTPASGQGEPQAPYPGFRIVAPENDTSIRANNGDFNITVHTDQPLRPGHHVVLLFDGKEVARGAALTFAMKNVDRGTHTAQARIVDSAGNELAVTEPVTFTVQRVAVGGRAR